MPGRTVPAQKPVELLQLPVQAGPTRPLKLPDPHAYVTGRVRIGAIPMGLILDFQEAATHVQGGDATIEDIHHLLDLTAALLNVGIAEWNLHRYARRDNQPFNAAGQITRQDVGYMPQDMMMALTQAIRAGDPEAENKKKSR